MTTYYVATDGSGDFSSVSEVNAASLGAGDVVAFRRGDVFEGTGLDGQQGVTYQAYGSGAKPLLTNIDGSGFTAASGSTIRDVAITHTSGAGVLIDGKTDVTVERVDFDYNVQSGSSWLATVQAWHSDNVRIIDSTFEHSDGNDHINVFNGDGTHVEGNTVTWYGPQDGDGIHLGANTDFYIGHNTVTSLGGGKGSIIASPWEGYQAGGGVIEFNDVTGGQFGIAPRVSDTLVQGNIIRDVGNQDHSTSWASAIWISASPEYGTDVTNLEITNNVVVDSPRAIATWDPETGLITEYEIHHNTIVNAAETYFNRDNGEMVGSFHDNLVVDSGARNVSADESNWSEFHNYYYRVDGQSDTGPDPQIDSTFHATLDTAQDYGLQQTVAVGPDGTSDGGGDTTSDGGGGTTDGGGTASGETEIVVRLAGDSGDGGDPHYRIVADGELLAEGDVTWSRTTATAAFDDPDAWRDVTVRYAADAAPGEVRVEFTNDAWGGADGDRNLLVDRISVNGSSYEAEGAGVVYERTWDTDIAGQELMSWQGALVFPTADASAPGGGNTAPAPGDDAIMTAEGAPVVVAAADLLANDADADGDALEVVSVSAGDATLGSVAFDSAAGELTYDPAGAFDALAVGEVGGDTFAYTVSDGTATVQATVAVAVEGRNDAPVAADDAGLRTYEGQALTIAAGDLLANDDDPDASDELRLVSVSAADGTKGTVSLDPDTGEVVYEPNGAFETLETGESAGDSFGYTIADGQGATASATASVAIDGLSDGGQSQDVNQVTVRMAGDSSNGGDPHYRIVADGKLLAEGDVTWSRPTTSEALQDPDAWREVTVTYAADVAPSQVRVEYTNDTKDRGDDRNLLVDRITVNEAVFEAEDPAVVYEREGRGDHRGQEVMNWNGALVFDTTSAPPPVPGGELLVRLAGDSGDGGNPHYRILADGAVLAEGDVTWSRTTTSEALSDPTAWQDVVVAYAGARPAGVGVEYTNDAWGSPGGDRNLLLDYIELDGEHVEAEDPSVVYHTENQGDLSGQEVMSWNGTMDFDFTA